MYVYILNIRAIFVVCYQWELSIIRWNTKLTEFGSHMTRNVLIVSMSETVFNRFFQFMTFMSPPVFICAVTVNLLYIIRLFSFHQHRLGNHPPPSRVFYTAHARFRIRSTEEMYNTVSLQNKVLQIHKLFSYFGRLQHEGLCTGKYTKWKHWRFFFFFFPFLAV